MWKKEKVSPEVSQLREFFSHLNENQVEQLYCFLSELVRLYEQNPQFLEEFCQILTIPIAELIFNLCENSNQENDVNVVTEVGSYLCDESWYNKEIVERVLGQLVLRTGEFLTTKRSVQMATYHNHTTAGPAAHKKK